MKRQLGRYLTLAVLAGLTTPAFAANKMHGCDPCCDPCPPAQPEMVERTVMVPTMVTETRTVDCVEYHREDRERTVTVYRRVPETKEVTQTFTVMVPETRTKTVQYTVCKPVYETVDQQYTVCVAHQETRQGTRAVCRQKPVQVTRTVCEDQGHWEERPCGAPSGCGGCKPCHGCGGCGGCGTYKVWVPNVVKKEVQMTVMKSEIVHEPYEYTCTVYKPETRTRQVQVCRMVPEKQTREVQYTVCVPQQREKTFNVTSYKCIAEEQQQTYTVCVPHKVQKEVQVRVCRMVEKTVMVPAHHCGGYHCCPPRRVCCR